jgi:hypothetical protein
MKFEQDLPIEIILKLEPKGYQVIENTLLQLPGNNGIHEFIEELREQVKKQIVIQKE